MVDYPTSIPIGEVTQVISLIKNKTVGDNLKLFAQCVWNIQGYAQYCLLGDGSPGFIVQSAKGQDPLAELEKLTADGVSAQVAIPWELIVKYLLDELLKHLLK